MKTKDLSTHISATYATLRLVLVVIGFVLPPLLWIGGYVFAKEPLAGSLSAYYYAGDGVMRNWFVGSLFVVGGLLFAYKGYTQLEDYALNFAAGFALLVALFPMTGPVRAGDGQTGDNPFSIHGICAAAFFVCIAYVCIFQASATVTLIADEARRKRYRRKYRTLGILMLLSPVIAFILTLLPWLRNSLIFFVEAAGVYVFASYWGVKSWEIRETQADQRAATGKIQTQQPDKLTDVFRESSVRTVA
jgi:hypothetical protein